MIMSVVFEVVIFLVSMWIVFDKIWVWLVIVFFLIRLFLIFVFVGYDVKEF